MSGKLLAAAWWLNFFALYWLQLLGIVEWSFLTSSATIFFLLGACALSLIIAGHEDKKAPQRRK